MLSASAPRVPSHVSSGEELWEGATEEQLERLLDEACSVVGSGVERALLRRCLLDARGRVTWAVNAYWRKSVERLVREGGGVGRSRGGDRGSVVTANGGGGGTRFGGALVSTGGAPPLHAFAQESSLLLDLPV